MLMSFKLLHRINIILNPFIIENANGMSIKI